MRSSSYVKRPYLSKGPHCAKWGLQVVPTFNNNKILLFTNWNKPSTLFKNYTKSFPKNKAETQELLLNSLICLCSRFNAFSAHPTGVCTFQRRGLRSQLCFFFTFKTKTFRDFFAFFEWFQFNFDICDVCVLILFLTFKVFNVNKFFDSLV